MQENINNQSLNESTNINNRTWKKTSLGSGEELFTEIIKQVNLNNIKVNSDSLDEWEKPVTFDRYPVPPFPINIFNEPIKTMIEETAESLQVPIDLPAFIAFGVLSTSLSKKFEVTPKKNWNEPLNLFVVSLLGPSVRKSPAFKAMMEPINNYQFKTKEKMQIDVNNRKTERTALENRIENLQREYGKSEDEQLLEEIKLINKRLIDLPALYLPTLLTDDATPESLISTMYQNNEKIAILSSEGGLFERFKNKYADVKYDVYLKSYSEDYLRTDRISRDTEEIKKPNLTVCITAQPDVIKNLPSSAHDRGLLARFIYSIPYDNLGERLSKSRELTEETNYAYSTLINRLLEWNPEEEIIPLELSEEALNLLFKTMDAVEREFQEDGAFHDELRSWGGKLIGQLLRIAGLLHVSNQVTTTANIDDIERTISYETLENAIKLEDYLIAHAQKAYGVMKQSRNFDDAEYVLKIILRKQKNNLVDKHTIHENTHKKIKGKERLKRAYDLLEYHSYIRQVVGGPSGRRGFILVNPCLNNNLMDT